MEKSKVKS